MPIPKIIHQTYSSFENIKPEIRNNIARFRAENPEYEYRFYTDSDQHEFIRTHYDTSIMNAYLKIDPVYGAARADFFRYLLIYKTGGLYLDIKSGVSQPLKNVIRDSDCFILSRWDHSPNSLHAGWGNHPEIPEKDRPAFQQWFILSEPGHPLLEAVIEKVYDNIRTFNAFRYFRNSWKAVMATTGDIPYTNAITPLLKSHSHRIVDIEQDMGLSYSIFQTNKGLYAHHQPGTHYTKQTKPLIQQNWPLSMVFAGATQLRLTARSLRSGIQRFDQE